VAVSFGLLNQGLLRRGQRLGRRLRILRYQSANSFYFFEVNRRSNQVTAKKKVPAGSGRPSPPGHGRLHGAFNSIQAVLASAQNAAAPLSP